MFCKSKIVGTCALAFGAGVLLCCFLPSSAMVFVAAAGMNSAAYASGAETAAPAVQKMEKERAQAVSAQSVRQTTTPEGSDVFGSLFL